MSSKFDKSKTDGVHSQLTKLQGTWKGIARTWFEPDKVADESPVEGTMKLIANGQFVLHEYNGSFQGNPLEGIIIIGYNLTLQRYETAWIDSFHTGTAIMFSEGQRGSDKFSMLGSYYYITPETEQKWGWRTEISMPNDNMIIITAYNVTPEGQEAKGTETVFERVK